MFGRHIHEAANDGDARLAKYLFASPFNINLKRCRKIHDSRSFIATQRPYTLLNARPRFVGPQVSDAQRGKTLIGVGVIEPELAEHHDGL
jgi:hypothetical protein